MEELYRKKILITTTGLSSVGQSGGISAYVDELANNLSNAGHDVFVYLVKEGSAELKNKNVTYKFVHYQIGSSYNEEEELVRKLLNDIQILRPEVIINNDTSYIAGLWPVLDKDIVKISVMHGFSIKRFELSNSGIIGKMACLNQEYIDHIVCQNSKMSEDASKKYDVDKEKFVFVPQSSKSNFEITKKPDLLTIIFGAGARVAKGADVMHSLCNRLKQTDWKFQVKWCGDAGLFVNDLNNDSRFQFLGNLSREEYLSELSKAHCIVIPTKLDTGPMLLVEAMANHVAPLCNHLRESAIPDLVDDGVNGILVENNNVAGYLNHIHEFIKYPNKCEEMGNKAFAYFQNNLTDKHQVQHYEKMFVIKKVNIESVPFSNKNIVYFHLKKTSHLPIWSLKRIMLKLRYTLEKPLYK